MRRDSYTFALVSGAVAIRVEDGCVADPRVALGGLATRPWRCHAAEEAVRGRPLDPGLARRAAALCLDGAGTDAERAFKGEFGRRAVARALLAATSEAAGG